MKNKNKKGLKRKTVVFNILAIICIILFCIAISPVTMQNDTYYTVKIGESIMENGIDGKDHFSWHEDLNYEYPHWLYDVMMYFIYNMGGWTSIYISTLVLACLLGIILYLTNVKICKNHVLPFVLTIGAIYLIKSYIAARAQLVTFILFILELFFIERFMKNRKIGYAIGLLLISLLMANLHVAVWPFFFVLFLPYIAEYLICVIVDLDLVLKIKKLVFKIQKKVFSKNLEKVSRIEDKIAKVEEQSQNIKQKRANSRKHPYKIKIERNKNVKYLILVMLIAALLGLCTPLGTTPYTYLIDTMQGNTTKNINEHLPLTLIDQKDILGLLIVVIALLMLTDIKIKLRDLFMFGGLVILALMSRRQISMLVLMGMPIYCKLILAFFKKYKCLDDVKKLFKEMTGLYGFCITLCIFVIVGTNIYKPKLDDRYVDESSYPVQACDYILEKLDISNMRIYNEYNYGSYMLYRGIPVFVDSRADLYTPEFNPGCTVFDDFLNISNIGTYYENKFDEYDITHVICFKNAKLNMFLSRNYEYKELYSDDRFVIYERDVV